jgi:serine/threonine protein kinase
MISLFCMLGYALKTAACPAAPEIIMREPYTLSVDMWSIGVITYILYAMHA